MVEQNRVTVVMPQAVQVPRGQPKPKRQPRCSSTVWDLAAVHGPLQATRTAPTIRPTRFTRVACTAEPLHEQVHTILVNETQDAVGTFANGLSDVEDVSALTHQGGRT